MCAVKMINVGSLPNIPWQERPEGLKTESPVWRYSENPVMGPCQRHRQRLVRHGLAAHHGSQFHTGMQHI